MKPKAGRTSKSSRTNRAGKSRSKRSTIGSSRSAHLDTLVATNAQALGIPLDAAWHEAIAFNLRLILLHAKLVDEFALADDTEPASVFYA
jgi:Protein of unknown function (DUF4089)